MSLNLFGSGYDTVGSSKSNFLIKTRGKVKIQWGSKYIDLIKDGKINVDSKFIFKEKEVGVKDGIYVIGDGDDTKVVLSIGGSQIDLKGEIGNTYVSFLGELETTSELKHTALQNIGFIYKDISSVLEDSLQNGIVYVESELKLYIVQDGQLTKFTVDFPNPFTKLFVIAKTDTSNGALVIKGKGLKNALMFNLLAIYSTDSDNYIDSTGQVFIRINDTEKVVISNSLAIFSNTVVSLKFESVSATNNSGFRLYFDGSYSTLEVDNLVVRNGTSTDSVSSIISNIYPKYWYKENNIISSALKVENTEQIEFTITLIYTNKFKVNDSLYVYVPITDSSITELILLPLKVKSIEGASIHATLLLDNMTEENYKKVSSLSTIGEALKYQTIFLVGSEDEISIIRRGSESIDLFKSTSIEDELNLAKVSTRIGNIQELSLKGKESGEEITIEGTGIYSDNGCFLKALYTSDYNLPDNDSSTKFASTEWVGNLIPKGAIIMFSGFAEEIPEGWHICDGTEGTPNLIGKFIKADTISGNEGGSSKIEILEENLPKHTHTFIESTIETLESGEHTHTISGTYKKTGTIGSNLGFMLGTDSNTTSSSGVHKHTINTANILLSYSGEGKALEFEPLYYSLIYIMKI